MAQMIAVNSETAISRKVAVERNEEFGLVRLVNHSVKASKDSTEMMVFERITLAYPGCGDTPTWLLERAAKADWITIQRKLREVSDSERLGFDGKTIDVTRLEDYFEMKSKREPFKVRLAMLANKELTLEDFEATLTKGEREQWAIIKGMTATDLGLETEGTN